MCMSLNLERSIRGQAQVASRWLVSSKPLFDYGELLAYICPNVEPESLYIGSLCADRFLIIILQDRLYIAAQNAVKCLLRL